MILIRIKFHSKKIKIFIWKCYHISETPLDEILLQQINCVNSTQIFFLSHFYVKTNSSHVVNICHEKPLFGGERQEKCAHDDVAHTPKGVVEIRTQRCYRKLPSFKLNSFQHTFLGLGWALFLIFGPGPAPDCRVQKFHDFFIIQILHEIYF